MSRSNRIARLFLFVASLVPMTGHVAAQPPGREAARKHTLTLLNKQQVPNEAIYVGDTLEVLLPQQPILYTWDVEKMAKGDDGREVLEALDKFDDPQHRRMTDEEIAKYGEYYSIDPKHQPLGSAKYFQVLHFKVVAPGKNVPLTLRMFSNGNHRPSEQDAHAVKFELNVKPS
jgi:hypothetical protein